MEGATAGAKRCFEILDRQDDVVDSPNAVAISSAQGLIEFRNVSFGYAQDRPVLHDVDLHIEPNQIVALVGGTGAGKSTLLSLVPRFYDPTVGNVSLDGRNVREITKNPCARRSGWFCRTRCFSPRPCARTSPTAGRRRPKRRSSMRLVARRLIISFSNCRTVMPAWSANAAGISVLASGNASESRAHS